MSFVIYGDSQSGNCYKIKLLCALLQIAHRWVEVDILAGDTRTDEFIKLNPNGKIPVLVSEDRKTLAESNAILYFLAQQTNLFPQQVHEQSVCLQWMFFEQYSHEPFIAVARFINKYLGKPADRLEEYVAKQEGGHKALTVMEQQLLKTPYLLGDELSIADISLFAYTHVADEGGFDLADYPAITAWISRIEKTPYFITIG